jgi:hypothetical protein
MSGCLQIYSVADPDDGTCESYRSESKCLEAASDFEAGENKCFWNYETDNCKMNDVSSRLNRIVVVAVISALVSAPIALVVQWIISAVLSKPTAVASDGDFARSGRQKELGVLPSSAADRVSVAQISASEMLREYKALTTKIAAYRKRLVGKELKEFDGECYCISLARCSQPYCPFPMCIIVFLLQF